MNAQARGTLFSAGLPLSSANVFLLGCRMKVVSEKDKEKTSYLYVEISKDAGIEPVLSHRGPNGKL